MEMKLFDMKAEDGLDFAALLDIAKAKHRKLVEITNSARSFKMIRQAKQDYSEWIKLNLTCRGIMVTVDSATEEPRALFALLAGKA